MNLKNPRRIEDEFKELEKQLLKRREKQEKLLAEEKGEQNIRLWKIVVRAS